MKVEYGNGQTEYGPGVDIKLTGTEVAEAIDLWLHTTGNLTITGPMTITVNGQLCKYGLVYVDPSGSVKTGIQTFYGRGPAKSVTRKYDSEYRLYCTYVITNLGSNPMSYESWVLDLEKEPPERQQAIFQKYAEALGYSVKPLASLQESSEAGSAFCFAIDVTSKG